ncbi:hypothetical protein GCM10014719_50330 [Planomonospora parontospora subsp. antibiotica]|uniref:hypothetical protein n=1 Tax=Planomonospora parontospora TaxID=58119 RepID=UPI00199EE9D1|nr:hypothetical protein [Planomonospora parontospora]GGL42910.1 hypothetical protein GCM10014719_50330 [Planomonospora parontospora subsp. antibiotica]GII18545.1 hypothetical protein Ppa05_52710 [Planomonospora parontospora subsp. antibiotica]
MVRAAEGRDPQPSAAVLDSQSVRSCQGGEAIGLDAGKRVRGLHESRSGSLNVAS